MSSKRLQSSAIKARIANVGATLSKTKGSTTKAKIMKWVKDNPRAHEKLWEFMESGLVWGLLGDNNDMTLPETCTKVAALQDPIRLQLVRRGLPTVGFGKDEKNEYKAYDPKWLHHLFRYKYQLTSGTPLKASMRMSEVRTVFDAVARAGGDRHLQLVIDGKLKMEKMKCYSGVQVVEEGDPQELTPEQQARTTHIRHNASKALLSLSDLGMAAFTPQTEILDNFSDTDAYVHTGRMKLGRLYDAFKDNDYFHQFDLRMTAAYGSDKWKGSVGDEVLEKRRVAKRALEDAAEALAEAKEKASDVGASTTTTTTPKKRRSIA